MNNLNKRFQAGRQYPGQQIGKSLEEVKADYILQRKAYGQTLALNAGSNPDIDINLPKDGRMLLGISCYAALTAATDNPTIDLEVNNTTFINSLGIRAIQVETLQEKMYYPLNLPLSGNDQITLDFAGVPAGLTVFMNFHYA
jgi:hypothetical protein